MKKKELQGQVCLFDSNEPENECVELNENDVVTIVAHPLAINAVLRCSKRKEAETREVLEVEMEISTNLNDPVRAYLRSIGSVPLLTYRQEVLLGRLMLEGQIAALVLNDSSAGEFRNLLETKIAQGNRARDRLVESNMRLVASVAKRYQGNGMPLMDLIQEGNIGLIKGTEKFDYRLGYRFSTYVTWWIRQAIVRSLAVQGHTIALPPNLNSQLMTFVLSVRKMVAKEGHELAPEEIAERLDMPVEDVLTNFKLMTEPSSLHTRVGKEKDEEVGNLIPDANPSVVDTVARSMLPEIIAEQMRKLTEKERAVIKMRFGLGGSSTMTLEQIGARLGLTRERIRQIESSALKKLAKNEAMRDLI